MQSLLPIRKKYPCLRRQKISIGVVIPPPPLLPGTMALSVKLTGAAVTPHSGNVYWTLRTAVVCLAIETYDHFTGSINMLCI